MAFEPRVIGVVWKGVDELTPTMNRISGGLTNMGRQSDYVTGRMSGGLTALDRTMHTVRRSAEYMVAGFGLYKITQAFQNYKQFRSELGQLNANLQVGRASLDQFGNSAIDVSTRTATPLNDVLQSFQNIAASFPELGKSARQHLFPVLAEIEARASRISDVTPQAFGTLTLAAARQFYGLQAVTRSAGQKGNANLIERTANQILQARYTTPGITSGQQLITYLPNLFMGGKAGGMSLPQTLAFFTTAQRFLGRPSVTSTYLRQLLIRVRRPTPQAAQFLQGSGLFPGNSLNSMNSYQILMRILQHTATLPGGASPEQLRQAASTGNMGNINLRGPAFQFLAQALAGKTGAGRQQSLVAAMALASGLGHIRSQVSSFERPLDRVNTGFNAWLDQNRMTQAAQSFSNMTVQMLTALNPLVDLLSRAVAFTGAMGTRGARAFVGAQNWAMHNIPGGRYALPGAEIGGIGYALRRAGVFAPIGRVFEKRGLSGLARLFMTRNMMGRLGTIAGEDIAGGRLAGRIVGGAIRGPLDVQALGSALRGVANGTPNAPFWVVIHPLSASTVPGMFGGGNKKSDLLTKLEHAAATEAKKALPYVGGAGAGGVVLRRTLRGRMAARAAARAIARGSIAGEAGIGGRLLMGGLGGIATGVAGALIFPDDLAHPGSAGRGMYNVTMGDFTKRVSGSSFLAGYMRASHGRIPRGLSNVITNFARGRTSQSHAERSIRNYLANNVAEFNRSGTGTSAAMRYLEPIAALEGRRLFRSRAGAGNGFFIGEADLNILIEPTAELKGLIRPQHVRAKVPTKYWQHGTPAPTSRGQSTKRHRG